MARVTVSFEEYQEGRLPKICVVSGAPTDDVFVYRTVRDRPAEHEGGWLSRLLSDLAHAVDARRPQDMLLGRIPLAAAEARLIRRSRRGWNAALVFGIVVVLASAWTGAAWSPAVSVLGLAVVGLSAVRRNRWKERLPRPTLTHEGRLVVLDNVHDAFAGEILARG